MQKYMSKIDKKIIVFIGITLSVYFFMKYIFFLALPFLLGVGIVAIFNPLLNYLKKKMKIGKGITMGVIMFILGCIPVLLLFFLGNWIMKNSNEISGLYQTAEVQVNEMIERYSKILEPTIKIEAKEIQQFVYQNIHFFIDNIRVTVIPNLVNQSFTYIKYIGIIGAMWVILVIFSIMLAKDYEKIKQSIKTNNKFSKPVKIAKKIFMMLKNYVKAQALIMIIIISIVSVGLLIIKIPNWFLWGILIGFLDVFPFIGTGIILIPLALWQFVIGNIGKALGALGIYVVCSFTREFAEPRLVGHKVGIHPIIMLMSIYFGVRLFGLFGIVTGPISFLIICESYKEITKEFFDVSSNEKTSENIQYTIDKPE